MACLDNFIILRGFCDDPASSSGLAVNDLPGISLKMVASLSNEEQKNFSGVWDEIYTRSTTMLNGDVMVAMQKFSKTNLLVDDEGFGFYKSDFDTEAASSEHKGVSIKIFGSKYLTLFVNKVTLRLENNTASSSNITIFDYNDGRTLDIIAFTPKNGLNEIQINKKYNIRGQRARIFVSYDGAIADAVQSSASSWFDNTRFALLRGAKVLKSSSVVEDNMNFDGETHGMILDLTVNCSIENLVCSNKDMFKIPLWYKLGEQLMQERMISERINKFTMLNSEKAEELMEKFAEMYKEQLDKILDNFEPIGDTLCFSCNKSRTHTYSLP